MVSTSSKPSIRPAPLRLVNWADDLDAFLEERASFLTDYARALIREGDT